MKKFFLRVYGVVRAPFAKLLGNNEPSIVGGIVGVAVTIATHYGLSLSAQQQTYISSGAFLLITWVIRQLVTPTTKVALTTDQVADLPSEQTVMIAGDPTQTVTVNHVHTHHHHDAAKPRKTAAKTTTTRRR